MEYIFARKCEAAVRELRRALEIEPGYLSALSFLVGALECEGREAEAASTQLQVLAARGDDPRFDRLVARMGTFP